MSLGTTIYKNRKKHHLSQTQLANQLHVSRQAISNWETDRFFPSMDNLFELSTIFDISIDNLLKENDDLKDEFEKQQIIKNANFFNNFGKGEELLFSLTLIFIGFKLAPLGLAIPIIYWFIKVKTVKKAKKYEK
ncbi:helix-turn-helix transcriptional regulator [Companilactobacillus futsaii]|uniref:Helix-turn-helix transcriptional regulator n=2 Tax=Companilactobacillus futsaii TaxID=938155 RepID=A0A5B7SX57_9LACO|nr:helix-turn-helix transcriptional regulator [Companilactobacillus futsaii]QCX24277.1 helix-turn-helix transcriptional regulator [Companilactobacillus futsaii]